VVAFEIWEWPFFRAADYCSRVETGEQAMWILLVLLVAGALNDSIITVPGYDSGATCEAAGQYLLREYSAFNHRGIVRNFLCIPGPKADFPQY
jgi:hypothetical protein